MNIFLIKMILAFAGILIGLLVNLLADVLPRKYGITITKEITKNPIQFRRNYKRIRKILVLIICVILTTSIWSASWNILDFILTLILFVYLGLIFIIDLEYRVILNSMIVFGIVAGMVYGINLNGFVSTMQGGAVGFFVLLGLFYFGKFLMPYLAKLRQIKLEYQALYKNDVLLGLIFGLILGWSAIINGLLIAFLLIGSAGLLISFYMIAQRKFDPNLAIPLAPFMALSIFISLFMFDYF